MPCLMHSSNPLEANNPWFHATRAPVPTVVINESCAAPASPAPSVASTAAPIVQRAPAPAPTPAAAVAAVNPSQPVSQTPVTSAPIAASQTAVANPLRAADEVAKVESKPVTEPVKRPPLEQVTTAKPQHTFLAQPAPHAKSHRRKVVATPVVLRHGPIGANPLRVSSTEGELMADRAPYINPLR